MLTRSFILVSLALAIASCGGPVQSDDSTDPSDPIAGWMVAHAPDYLEDRAWRRAELEASLWKPELPYARKRLAGYGLEDEGWDLLPEMPTRFTRVGGDEERWQDLDVEETPETREEWIALGERVFWGLPMRRDAYLQWVATRPDLWDEIGLERRDDGTLRGVVKFENILGETRVAATCGMCHGDGGLAGRANRELDLGEGRLAYAAKLGREAPEFGQWGPGRVDVTDDNVIDPVAIPDLWGVSHQSHLNSSGAVALDSPAALAIRFETQYIVGHSYQARPSRTLTWALAMYVYSLRPPSSSSDRTDLGETIFERACASCHQPDHGFSGPLVDADALTSNPLAATSAMRGTGYYKTPSLLGISGGGPYLHDASAPTLEALLQSGHPYGSSLPEPERQALIDYLHTL